MARELPFKDLEGIIHTHREILQNAITDQYMLAKAAKMPAGSEYTQEQIYNKFCELVTDTELEMLRNKFYSVLIQRDKNLKTYVMDTVEYIKGMKGNEDLIQAQFIQTMARDKKTGIVSTRTTAVTGYYNERNIDSMIRERYKEFVPEFVRPNNEKANLEEIEIMSVSNLTGLYDPKKIPKNGEALPKNEDILKHLEYELYSRIKTSEREMNKFVDWLLALRRVDDYPYDAIAMRIVVPNVARKCGDSGTQMYNLKDYITNTYKKFGKILLKNVKTAKDNKETEEDKKIMEDRKSLEDKKRKEGENIVVKKLNKDSYSKENFKSVLIQMRDMYAYLRKKNKGNKPYEPNRDQAEALLQYIQMKHYANDDRAEVQIMNKEMYTHYIGEYVGHTAKYIDGRDKERVEYLENPAKSDARKDIEKREKRTLKNKNRINTKETHLGRMLESDDDIQKDDAQQKEPSVTLLARLLEDMYRQVFMHHEY